MGAPSITKDEFIEQMTEKYGDFDFDSLKFKLSKTTLKCNKCGVENTKSALRHISCTCKDCYGNMSQRSNNEDFIQKVKKLFGKDKFVFDKLKYKNAITKVRLYCTEHKDYINITPNKLLEGSGCNVCNKNIPHTTESFIDICKVNYGDSFTYEKTEYVNNKLHVTVFCKEGNHEWEVSPQTLIKGKTGCGVCSGKGGRTTEQFITESKKIHGDKYDYSTTKYKNSEEKVVIICPIDGEFLQNPKSHLFGRGCPRCGKYGYQPTKPGYFYVQKLTNENKVVYKYGITGDVDRRVHEQSRNSHFEHEVLVERYFEDGNQPLVLETFIKKYIVSGVVSTEELPSGFTETFNEEHLQTVLDIVNNFK